MATKSFFQLKFFDREFFKFSCCLSSALFLCTPSSCNAKDLLSVFIKNTSAILVLPILLTAAYTLVILNLRILTRDKMFAKINQSGFATRIFFGRGSSFWNIGSEIFAWKFSCYTNLNLLFSLHARIKEIPILCNCIMHLVYVLL